MACGRGALRLGQHDVWLPAVRHGLHAHILLGGRVSQCAPAQAGAALDLLRPCWNRTLQVMAQMHSGFNRQPHDAVTDLGTGLCCWPFAANMTCACMATSDTELCQFLCRSARSLLHLGLGLTNCALGLYGSRTALLPQPKQLIRCSF